MDAKKHADLGSGAGLEKEFVILIGRTRGGEAGLGTIVPTYSNQLSCFQQILNGSGNDRS